MSGIIIVILVLICVFVAASIALSRTTQAVENARDTEYLELEGNWIRYSVTGGGAPVVRRHGRSSSSSGWGAPSRRARSRPLLDSHLGRHSTCALLLNINKYRTR